jgi:hypothetical protein
MNKFAKQFGDHVQAQLWDVARSHGIEEDPETFRKIRLFFKAGSALIDEEDGCQFEHEMTEAEMDEIESFDDPLRFTAMALAMHNAGVEQLNDGDPDQAVEGFTAALLIAGFGMGRMNIVPIDEITKRAKRAAQGRHKTTHAMRDEVRRYWLTSIDRKISNSKAADILVKEFPLEHRTLAGYIAEFKRELIEKV